MPPSSTKPVLIAGSGPTGLALALTLAKNKVPVRIIEKDSQFHVGQRGPGIQPRTLELYHFLGVLPDIMEGGKPLPQRCVYEMPEGRKPLKIYYMIPFEEPTPSVPYRNALAIGQSHNEEILRSHLADLGVHVELGTELVSFEQDDGGVTVHVLKRDGAQEVPDIISASYLVGADGAKSVVRKQLGLTFVGETREEDRMILVDLEITGIDADYWHSWGDSSSSLHLRPTEYDGLFSCIIFGRGPDFQSMSNDPQALFKRMREMSNRPELEFGTIRWISEWRPNIRMANKFGEGRVFIAGDAGHAHSPTGGQGLNSGFQDAYNLAWKLSLVYKGLADPSLLESYNEERLPVIAEMLGRTTALLDQVTKPKADSGSTVHTHVRSNILHQLGINCRWSGIVVDEQPEAKDVAKAGAYLAEDPTVLYAGDRAPEAPGLFNVGAASTKPTSLFSIFGPTHHTALVFVADVQKASPVLRLLEGYPEGTVTKVVVLPKDAARSAVAPGADLTLVDQEGHAHTAYPPASKGFSVIVVRPDGVVGAIVKDAQSVQGYFDGILAHN